MRPLIAVVGNTGVGKSQLAVELAKALRGEVINGDAMQMYRGLDVITNKHPEPEREGVAHHLLGTESWRGQITVQDFENRAVEAIYQLHSENKVPILVGGTHYYVQSLIAENALISSSTSTSKIEEKTFTADQLNILETPNAVERKLKEVDPTILAKFHPNDTRRLRRALEIWYETGKPASDIYESQKSGKDEQKLKLRYRVLVFWVWCQREVLADRLDTRVDKMVDQGLLAEIKAMHAEYNPGQANSGIWQVLGFRQFLDYLESPTPENWAEGLEAMKGETRQYAKRQRKWIKNKLSPLIYSLGGDFAVVDSSDLTQWSTQVSSRAVNISREWLRNDDKFSTPLVPEYLKDETMRQRQEFDKSQWTRYKCDICSEVRGKEVVLMGDDDYKMHLESKGHRALKARAARAK